MIVTISKKTVSYNAPAGMPFNFVIELPGETLILAPQIKASDIVFQLSPQRFDVTSHHDQVLFVAL